MRHCLPGAGTLRLVLREAGLDIEITIQHNNNNNNEHNNTTHSTSNSNHINKNTNIKHDNNNSIMLIIIPITLMLLLMISMVRQALMNSPHLRPSSELDTTSFEETTSYPRPIIIIMKCCNMLACQKPENGVRIRVSLLTPCS